MPVVEMVDTPPVPVTTGPVPVRSGPVNVADEVVGLALVLLPYGPVG